MNRITIVLLACLNLGQILCSPAVQANVSSENVHDKRSIGSLLMPLLSGLTGDSGGGGGSGVLGLLGSLFTSQLTGGGSGGGHGGGRGGGGGGGGGRNNRPIHDHFSSASSSNGPEVQMQRGPGIGINLDLGRIGSNLINGFNTGRKFASTGGTLLGNFLHGGGPPPQHQHQHQREQAFRGNNNHENNFQSGAGGGHNKQPGSGSSLRHGNAILPPPQAFQDEMPSRYHGQRTPNFNMPPFPPPPPPPPPPSQQQQHPQQIDVPPPMQNNFHPSPHDSLDQLQSQFQSQQQFPHQQQQQQFANQQQQQFLQQEIQQFHQQQPQQFHHQQQPQQFHQQQPQQFHQQQPQEFPQQQPQQFPQQQQHHEPQQQQQHNFEENISTQSTPTSSKQKSKKKSNKNQSATQETQFTNTASTGNHELAVEDVTPINTGTMIEDQDFFSQPTTFSSSSVDSQQPQQSGFQHQDPNNFFQATDSSAFASSNHNIENNQPAQAFPDNDDVRENNGVRGVSYAHSVPAVFENYGDRMQPNGDDIWLTDEQETAEEAAL